jgi:hypothetical protein
MAFEAEIAAAREAMDGFMAAFNAEDAQAIRERWFHFPHVRFHSGKVTVMERPEDFFNLVWRREGSDADWGHTRFDLVEPVDAGPDKVHFRVRFTRHRRDGTPIASYPSFYIVTRIQGRWAIQGRSSWAA